MPPQSRGARLGSYSLSTSNLPTLKSLRPINTSLSPFPDAVTTAHSLQPPRPAAFDGSERFPDLDDDRTQDERHGLKPRPVDGRYLYPPAFDRAEEDESEEESDEEDDEEQDEDDQPHNEQRRHLDQDAASDSAQSQDSSSVASSASSDDASHQDEPTPSAEATAPATVATSAPSTLRAPPYPSPSSSADSPPPYRPARPHPNRSQSLYAEPAFTRSHSAIPTFHASPSRAHLNPAAFAPPFYNRPPTPLPPSPSLKSLLGPLPFSTLPSRSTSRPPTPGTRTPVDSSSDTDVHPPATVTSTAAHSTTSLPQPQPTASPVAPKIPTYEYYGFTLYVTSSLIFLFYLLWAFLPKPFLHLLGITYYPNRWWALAVPAWLVVLLVWIYVALGSYNTGALTLGVGELDCLVDEKGRVAALGNDGVVAGMGRHGEGKGGSREKEEVNEANHMEDRIGESTRRKKRRKGRGNDKKRGEEPDWKRLWSVGTDAVLDVPIGGVCEVLYGETRDADGDERQKDMFVNDYRDSQKMVNKLSPKAEVVEELDTG